jgi:Atypical PilZ domain, cyclic di-GMP receptor
VPESFLGDGLVYEELLPVAWTPGPLIEGLALARLNVDNQQLLAAEASLDEALKDESPALLHELQRLEFKINILLRLTAEIAVRDNALPAPERVRLSSHALEWYGERAPTAGSGLLALYVNPAMPQSIKIPCLAERQIAVDNSRATQLRFVGLSEAVVHLLDKLIFRHHRRLIAGAKHAP